MSEPMVRHQAAHFDRWCRACFEVAAPVDALHFCQRHHRLALTAIWAQLAMGLF